MSIWISVWQKSITNAIKYNLIDIYTPEAWCDHLRKALLEITDGRSWVMGEFAILEDRINNGKLDHNSLAATMQARLSNSSRKEQGKTNATNTIIHSVSTDI